MSVLNSMTIYTVGYNEVRSIDTPALSAITISLILFGCTGVIFLSGALIQFFTLDHLNKTSGIKRMNKQIEQLKGHVVVCGFGALATVLANDVLNVFITLSARALNPHFGPLPRGSGDASPAGLLSLPNQLSTENIVLCSGQLADDFAGGVTQ